MALQLPPKSASAVPEGPRQGPGPVAPGKDGGDGSMVWCPETRPSSSRRNAVLVTVAVAMVVMGTLTVGFAVLQETRLQRQEMLELKQRILVLEHQLRLKSEEDRGTQDHAPADPSSEFLQSVTRLPGDQGGLAPQANQTKEAGGNYALSRPKRSGHQRKEKDKGKKKKNKQKSNKGNRKQRNRCRNCDVIERMIDCKLNTVRMLHAATRLQGLTDNPLDGDTFQWARPSESYFENSFEIRPNYRGHVTGIKIHRRGVYHIYSQVAMRGFHWRVEKLECGHVTVVTRGSTDTILMKSLTAQRESIDSSAAENGWLDPIDTALQVGDFVLDAGDIIQVKRAPHCEPVRYQADPHYTYFGVNKLHDLSPPRDDCPN